MSVKLSCRNAYDCDFLGCMWVIYVLTFPGKNALLKSDFFVSNAYGIFEVIFICVAMYVM